MARSKNTKAQKPKTQAGTDGAPAGLPADLANIRDRIDQIDAGIHELLNERARCAQLVGISKSASGKAVDFYRPEREAEVLRRALERNKGPLRDEEIVRLFQFPLLKFCKWIDSLYTLP